MRKAKVHTVAALFKRNANAEPDATPPSSSSSAEEDTAERGTHDDEFLELQLISENVEENGY